MAGVAGALCCCVVEASAGAVAGAVCCCGAFVSVAVADGCAVEDSGTVWDCAGCVALTGVAGTLCCGATEAAAAAVVGAACCCGVFASGTVADGCAVEESGAAEDCAGCVGFSSVAGVISDDGPATAGAGCGATTVTPRGVDPAGAVATGSGGAGLSVSSWGVTGCAG